MNLRALPDKIGRERLWKGASTGIGLLFGLMARKLMRAGYEAIRRDKDAPSPFDPNNPEFSWPNLLVWAAAAGLGLGLAKVLTARVARFGWEAATGTLPPGVAQEAAVG